MVKMIDFTSGANPLGPSNKAKNAIRSHVRDIATFDANYINRLKSYISKREGIEKDCISFGCGSSAILSSAIELTDPKRMLILYPVSQRHGSMQSRHDIEIATVSLRSDENFEFNTKLFCNAMEGCDAALLASPHDVTGTVISPDDIIKVSEEAERLGVYLFIDESYVEYTGIHSIAARIAKSRRAMIVRTFSTFHALGGLRFGYLIGPPDITRQIESRLEPSWITSIAPWAAIASMKDKKYHRRTLLFIEREKAYLHKKLSDIKGVKCLVSPTNILVIGLRKDYADISGMFKKYHILIQMFADGDGNACIRLPIQTHRQNAYFVRAVQRIMEA